jgi:hypothetical protein
VGEREERLRQRQDSVTEQLHDLTIVAERKGMYDAADWIKRQFRPRPCEQHQFSSSLTEMSECPGCVLPWRDLALASSPSPPARETPADWGEGKFLHPSVRPGGALSPEEITRKLEQGATVTIQPPRGDES